MQTLRVLAPKKGAVLDTISEELLSYCVYNCGFRRLPWMLEEVHGWLEDGFDPWVIKEAMRRTSRAPRPSWAYLAAIIRNARACHFFDPDSFVRNKHTTDDDLPL